MALECIKYWALDNLQDDSFKKAYADLVEKGVSFPFKNQYFNKFKISYLATKFLNSLTQNQNVMEDSI